MCARALSITYKTLLSKSYNVSSSRQSLISNAFRDFKTKDVNFVFVLFRFILDGHVLERYIAT